jgi:hypothetical protein
VNELLANHVTSARREKTTGKLRIDNIMKEITLSLSASDASTCLFSDIYLKTATAYYTTV